MDTKTIFVGLSGGVDSSVAALRLKQQGHNVVGVFIKVWHPDFLVCSWEEERLDAMRAAAQLDIPFLTCDAVSAYKDDVAQYFIDGYQKGETPNPDVMCNKYVKFGAFLSFAKERGADGIATGHYAQKEERDGMPILKRGIDTSKDQSYFLWTLTPDVLSYVHFPIGDTTKTDIRKEAERAGLHTAEKKDSQGICFLGHIDIKEFLSHYIDLTEGVVLDEAGNHIGVHDGAEIYTVGQRHGFRIHTATIDDVPHYVSKRDITKNTITVSPVKPISKDGTLTLSHVNWTQKNTANTSVSIQTRYRQTPIDAQLIEATSEHGMLKIIGTMDTPAVGQSCVVYKNDECLGGGIIS